MPLGLWGAADQAMTLSLEVLRLLSQALGVRSPGRPAPDLAELRLSDPKLPEAVRDRLVAALGNKHVRDDPQARALHTRGKSRLDLLRLRAGEADDAPDLVLLPGSHEEVLAVLVICSEQRVAVVPFGGGTSVVGGLEPRVERFAGVVALDVRRLDRLAHGVSVRVVEVPYGPSVGIGVLPGAFKYLSYRIVGGDELVVEV